MAPIEGVLFDKDGTLFDFAASWNAWLVWLVQDLAQGDAARAADLADRLGFDLAARSFRPGSLSIAGTVAEQAAALSPALPDMSLADLVQHLVRSAATAEMIAVENLAASLQALTQRGLVLGVATNDAESAAKAHLRRAGIDGFFSFVAGFDSGYGAKPEPGMCRAFAEHHDLDPAHVLMVGDSTHDLIAGRAAGMRVAAVLTGLATQHDLQPHADIVLADVTHLPGWLAEWPQTPSVEAQKAT